MSQSATRSLRQAQRVVEQAARVIKRDFIGTWLREPVPALNGMKPLELIERGEHDRVWGLLYEFEYGGFE